jgi:hypothetical protein
MEMREGHLNKINGFGACDAQHKLLYLTCCAIKLSNS